MRGFIRKTHHLILNARTISGSDALYHSAVKRRKTDIFTNDIMGIFICICKVTDHLVFADVLIFKGKRDYHIIAFLLLQSVKIY